MLAKRSKFTTQSLLAHSRVTEIERGSGSLPSVIEGEVLSESLADLLLMDEKFFLNS